MKMQDAIEIFDSSSEDNDVPRDARFYLPGPPIPQERPKLWKSRWVNPSGGKQKKVKELLLQEHPEARNNLLFAHDVLQLQIWFLMKRPKDHFKANNRERGLKALWSGIWHQNKKPDIDNLLKFYLDALVGIGYSDDKQVVSVVAHKILDSRGPCEGGTVIILQRMEGDPGLPIGYHLDDFAE